MLCRRADGWAAVLALVVALAATAMPAVAEREVGTKKNDKIRGTRQADELSGRAGNDRIKALGGKDRVKGGKGKDKLRGGRGRDKVKGAKGADNMFGNAGNDVLVGGPDADLLTGGDGDDTLDGGPGRDSFGMLEGVELESPGNDTIMARDGLEDEINCGEGEDTAVVDEVEDGVIDCEEVIEP